MDQYGDACLKIAGFAPVAEAPLFRHPLQASTELSCAGRIWIQAGRDTDGSLNSSFAQ
jgi:hypothetical protein